MLYQYVIKILMSNSDTVFTALVMGVLGYIGWLCWKINERTKEYVEEMKKHDVKLNKIKVKMEQVDQGIYKDLLDRLNNNINEMGKVLLVSQDNNDELERLRSDIISEVKDSTDQVKDIVMILMNNKARSFKNTSKKDSQSSNQEIYILTKAKDNQDSDLDK
ncbi:MAG: hypothetical protein ACLFUI_00605 [Halanaerobiales bacterium]